MPKPTETPTDAHSAVSLLSPREEPEEYAAIVRTARLIRLSGKKTIGFIPATPTISVTGLMVQVAHSLGQLSALPVSVVDANTRLPALAELLPRSADVPSEVDVPSEMSSTSLAEGVTLVTVPPGREHRPNFDLLESVIADHGARSGHVLVDLTGFDLHGEHLAAYELVEGLLVVAEAGATKERQLSAITRDIPKERDLGVLLIG